MLDRVYSVRASSRRWLQRPGMGLIDLRAVASYKGVNDSFNYNPMTLSYQTAQRTTNSLKTLL